MKNTKAKDDEMEMRDEYDFTGAIRGKYAKKFSRGTNIVVLDPDVAKVFHNSKEVNEILRTISRLATQKAR
jgi:hypothetical protein